MADKIYSPREAALTVLRKAEELYKSSNLSKCGTFTKVHRKAKDEGYSEESADKIAGHAKAMEKSEKPLAKKYEGFEKVKESAAKSGASDPAAVAAAVGMKKYGKKAFEEHAHEGKKFKKDESEGPGSAMMMSEENPDEKADAELGENVEREVEQHEENNEDPKHELKGHIKLAKFMGRMEHKRGQKAKEMDKAEEDPSKMSGKTGMVRGTTESNLNQKGVNQTGNNGRSGGMSEAGNMVRNSSHMMPKQAASTISDAKEQHKQTLGEMKAQPKPKLPG